MRWTDERRGGVQQNKAAFISPGCNGEITACRRCLKSALAQLLFSVRWMWFGVTHTLMEGRRDHRECHFTSKAPQFSSFPPNHQSSFIRNPSLPPEKKSVYSHHLSCRMRRSAGEFTSRADAFHPRALSLSSYFPAIFRSCVIYRFSPASWSCFACRAPLLLSSVLQTREHNHIAYNLNRCVYQRSFVRLASWKCHSTAHVCKAITSLPVFNNTGPAF